MFANRFSPKWFTFKAQLFNKANKIKNFHSFSPLKSNNNIGLFTETIASNKKTDSSWKYKVAFLGSIPIVTLYLGIWQIQRLKWKENLLHLVNSRSEAEPILLNRQYLKDIDLEDLEFRAVMVQGEFLHDREILLGPRTHENKIGYYIITPLRLDNGFIIPVRRGWISREKVDKSSRPESLVEGVVTIKGLIRKGEKVNSFTPENIPEKNQWFYVNLDELSSHLGTLPLLIDQVTETSPYMNSKLINEGIPIPKAKEIHLSNNHAQYAFTWLSLSFFTTIMTIMFVRKGRPYLPAKGSDIVRKINY